MSEPERDAEIPQETIEISTTVNGEEVVQAVPTRMLLVHFLREELGLTGTRIGCETSACGCCSVLLDGKAVKSCTLLVTQADGREITTIEGISDGDGNRNGDEALNELQRSFSQNHAQQCGFCTAGMVITATSLLEENPDLTREEIEHGLAGNLCRCTGYEFIVDAIEEASDE